MISGLFVLSAVLSRPPDLAYLARRSGGPRTSQPLVATNKDLEPNKEPVVPITSGFVLDLLRDRLERLAYQETQLIRDLNPAGPLAMLYWSEGVATRMRREQRQIDLWKIQSEIREIRKRMGEDK